MQSMTWQRSMDEASGGAPAPPTAAKLVELLVLFFQF
jgi:hypothetical protein